MKISAEVREFAKNNPQPVVPSEGSPEQGRGGEGRSLEEAEKGMAERSERYRDGGDLYVAAAQ